MRIGLSNGLLLGVMSLVIIGGYIMLFKGKSFLFAFSISGCIGISLAAAMMISGFNGAIIPIIFKKTEN